MNEEESVQSLSGEEMIGKGRRGPSGVVAGGVVIHDRCVRRGDWMGAGARPTGSNVVGYCVSSDGQDRDGVADSVSRMLVRGWGCPAMGSG